MYLIETSLVTVGPLTQALALAFEAGDIDKLRDIAGMAEALRSGAKARGLGVEAENQAAEVVLRAERAIGLSLNAMTEAGTLRGRGQNLVRYNPRSDSRDAAEGGNLVGLEDIGVSQREAERYRLLARISPDIFEAKFATLKATSERDPSARLAKMDFYRMVKAPSVKVPEAEAPVHGEGWTRAFDAFRSAADAFIAVIDQTPDDELREAATVIQRLVSSYTVTRNERARAA